MLEHFGHDYKTTTDRYVKSIESNEEFYVDPVMKEVNSLKEKIAQYEAREQHATDASVVKQFESDASSFISKRSDLEYLAALPDAVDQIRETIVEHWRANKQELSIKEAAEAVEEALTRQAQALSKTQKLRKSLGVFERAPETKKPAEPTSLSGQHVSRSTQTTKPARAKSEEERLADAINEFFGT